jgi:RNA polymerase sigma-70 factor (ECF subfamily)
VSSAVQEAVAESHRRDWAYVLAATVRAARDLDLAEECVQEAFVSALEAWERDVVPDNPRAWLITAAKRKMLDRFRREQTFRNKMPLLLEPEEEEMDLETLDPDFVDFPDDRLRLIFTCCHPAIARETQLALTLRLVCGVTTGDIAELFLVSEPTMAARVTRGKKKIEAAGIPYRVPAASELPDRLDAVLSAIHLLYTTGYSAPSGDSLVRDDVVLRSLELTRMLLGLMPDEPEVKGLLALLLVNHARRATRVGPDGRLLRLEDQDRSQWDSALIDEGDRLVVEALRAGRPGRFTLQAAIAALHALAPSYEETDWVQIVTLYDRLEQMWASPVVALNRAIAVSMADGPAVGLEALQPLESDPRLGSYRYLPAAKADMLRRLGRREEAAAAYEAALAVTDSEPEREYLSGRIREMRSG